MATDPYKTLGVSPGASDDEVRSAYRRLVQRHHPDHNEGSPEATRRFEEVQEAYTEIRRRRETRAPRRPDAARARHGDRPGPPPPADPEVESRLADLERQVREAQDRARRAAADARERARRAAREAAASGVDRPSDEELGYVTTDDSFTKILSDARDELAGRFADAREHPVVKRVSDLIEGLDELASKLDRERGDERRR